MIRKAAARHVFCACDLVNLLSSLRSLEERSGAPEPFVDLMIRVDSLLISKWTSIWGQISWFQPAPADLKTTISKNNPSWFWSFGHLQTFMWFLMTICGHLRWMIRPMCELKRWVFNDIESEAYQSLSRSYQTYRQVPLLTVSSQGPCNKKQLKNIH